MYAEVCDCPKKFLSEFINTNYWITTTGLTYILEKIDTVQQSNAKSIAIYQTKSLPLHQEIIRCNDTQNAEVQRWNNRRRLLLRCFLKVMIWWHHLVKMLIADSKAIGIFFALFRIWIIDATLVLHKIYTAATLRW